MPISVLQEKSAGGSAVASVTVTITGTTAGSVLVVGGSCSSTGTTVTLSDQHGDAFTDSGKGTVNGDVGSERMGAFLAATAGTTTVTATFSPTPSFCEVVAWEVAGLPAASFDKAIVASSTTGTAISTGASGVLASASEIVINYSVSVPGCNSGSGNLTADEAGTGLTANQNYAQHSIVSSTASVTATCVGGVSGAWDAWLVSLQSAGAAAAKGGTLTLMGVG